jgi:hypothetical protein
VTPTEIICGFVVTALLGALGWVKFFFERRDKRIAETALKAAREEMERASNRADAPLFTPTTARQESFRRSQGESWNWRNENLLSPMRAETPKTMPPGTLVVLPISNFGEGVRSVAVALDGVPIRVVRYTDGTPEIWGLLEYPHDPAVHGKRQTITFRFESEHGVHRLHHYETEHGRNTLTRIDPPLPGF